MLKILPEYKRELRGTLCQADGAKSTGLCTGFAHGTHTLRTGFARCMHRLCPRFAHTVRTQDSIGLDNPHYVNGRASNSMWPRMTYRTTMRLTVLRSSMLTLSKLIRSVSPVSVCLHMYVIDCACERFVTIASVTRTLCQHVPTIAYCHNWLT